MSSKAEAVLENTIKYWLDALQSRIPGAQMLVLQCDFPLIRLDLSTPWSQEPLMQFTFHLHDEPVELQICT